MPTTIPYAPSLVLGSIVDSQALKTVKAISELLQPVDAAQETLNSFISMRRSLQMTADELWFEPCLPAAWPRATLSLRRGGHRLHVVLHRGAGDAADGLAVRVGERIRWRELPVSSRLRVAIDA